MVLCTEALAGGQTCINTNWSGTSAAALPNIMYYIKKLLMLLPYVVICHLTMHPYLSELHAIRNFHDVPYF